jgi:BioD-like phosphotransacetylase family protein
LAVHSLLKERLISVVINRIALKEMSRIRHRIIPYLREKGVALWAGIPEDSLINSLTMREVKEILRGATAWGEEKEGNLVVDFTISSSYLGGPLGLFRRIPQKIILLGLDPRKSAGSEGSKFVTGILLTGGRRPGDIVVETAAEEGIPLIVIPGDTFTAMESLERAVVDPKWGDTLKMNRFVEFLEQETSIERFIKTLMEG